MVSSTKESLLPTAGAIVKEGNHAFSFLLEFTSIPRSF